MFCAKEVRMLCPSVYTLDGAYIIVSTVKMPLWSVLVSAEQCYNCIIMTVFC